MKLIPFFNAASGFATNHRGSLSRIRGNFNGTTATRFLMVFDANSYHGPQAGDVPLFPAITLFQGSAGNPTPFFQDFDINFLEYNNGLYWAVSTTQETFTQSTDTVDIDFELSDPEDPTGTTFQPLVSGADSLTVYADGQPNKNIYSFKATNVSAGTLYLMLFTYANPANGAIPVQEWVFTTGQAQGFGFGNNGYHPVQSSNSAAGVASITQGCYLVGSTTPGVLTASTGGNWTLQAEFK